jgi:hypothetical protein
MVSFTGGKIVHGGLPVIAGVRYILPVFLFLSHNRSSAPEVRGGAGEKRIEREMFAPSAEKRAKRDAPFSAPLVTAPEKGVGAVGAAPVSHSFSFSFD